MPRANELVVVCRCHNVVERKDIPKPVLCTELRGNGVVLVVVVPTTKDDEQEERDAEPTRNRRRLLLLRRDVVVAVVLWQRREIDNNDVVRIKKNQDQVKRKRELHTNDCVVGCLSPQKCWERYIFGGDREDEWSATKSWSSGSLRDVKLSLKCGIGACS